MIEFVLACAVLLTIMVCLTDWRAGMVLCLAVGFLQDPIRKVVPGQPVYLTAAIVFAAALVLVGAHTTGYVVSLRPIRRSFPSVRAPLNAFIVLVILQCIMAYVRTGRVAISAIGLVAYLSPIPALLLGFYYVRDRDSVGRFIRWYVAGCVAMGCGIYFSYFGIQSRLLDQVGETQYAYSHTYGVIQLWSGFFRTPETAAWHIATAICLCLVLTLSRRDPKSIAKYIVIVLVLLPALLLTGRRKFLVEIPIFLGVYLAILAYFQRGARRATLGGLAIVTAALLAYLGGAGNMFGAGVNSYFERGAELQGSMVERVRTMTIGSFSYVFAQNGFFGSGAGTGSQGAQYFGGGADIIGSAAEGGIGKIMAELGIPGLIVLLWVGIALARAIWKRLPSVAMVGPEEARTADGLTALLITNGFLFINGHQAFGDVFVLLMLGWMFGFLLALTTGTAPRGVTARVVRPSVSGLSGTALSTADRAVAPT
jgi:hypothetical protein